jgi:hypothetical protein
LWDALERECAAEERGGAAGQERKRKANSERRKAARQSKGHQPPSKAGDPVRRPMRRPLEIKGRSAEHNHKRGG